MTFPIEGYFCQRGTAGICQFYKIGKNETSSLCRGRICNLPEGEGVLKFQLGKDAQPEILTTILFLLNAHWALHFIKWGRLLGVNFKHTS